MVAPVEAMVAVMAVATGAVAVSARIVPTQTVIDWMARVIRYPLKLPMQMQMQMPILTPQHH
jgi:hypothetical protein